jgi:hypothetical protein
MQRGKSLKPSCEEQLTYPNLRPAYPTLTYEHANHAQDEDEYMKHALPRKVKTGANGRSKTRLKTGQKPPSTDKKPFETSKSAIEN